MATSLTTLIADAKERADLTDSAFVSDAAWTRWINLAVRELWGLALSHNAEALATSSNHLGVTSGTIPLPTGCLRLLYVEKDPDTSPQILPQTSLAGKGRTNQISYYVSGTTISITPREQSAGDYRLHYVPSPTELVGFSDSLDSRLEQVWGYISIRAAISARGKEEVSTKYLIEELALCRDEVKRTFARRGGHIGMTPIETTPLNPWAR